jgi:hypothetical protein
MSRNHDPENPANRLVPFRHEGHKKPVTRRDFLSQGFLSGAAMIALPTWLSTLAGRPARAQMASCGLTAGSGRIPFMCFDLAGGANICGSNVLAGGPLGQLDLLDQAGYIKLGLPASMTPDLPGQVNTELGLAFHADSAFLRGILSKTSVATRANINGSLICGRSDNDTGNNPHNPTYGISRAGADGDLVTLIGTESSESGGKSMAPPSMIDPAVRPTRISSGADAVGLVDTGKLVQLLSQNDAASVMTAAQAVSQLKLDRLAEDPVLLDQIRCGYIESADLVATYGDPTLLDPNNDLEIVGDDLTSIYTVADLDESTHRKTAAVMKLVVNGFAGAGTIELGGYDYHDGSRATGEVRDFLAGQAMGAALEYAARRSQQLMLYVFTDGSLSSDGQIDNSVDGRDKGIWRSDNSSTGGSFMLVHDPAGPPLLTTPTANQIGYFRPSGSVETSANRVANSVTTLAEAIVLNYLALHDEISRIDTVLPGHGLGAGAELDSLIAFQPIR